LVTAIFTSRSGSVDALGTITVDNLKSCW
jgi:hypothetical protein